MSPCIDLLNRENSILSFRTFLSEILKTGHFSRERDLKYNNLEAFGLYQEKFNNVKYLNVEACLQYKNIAYCVVS